VLSYQPNAESREVRGAKGGRTKLFQFRWVLMWALLLFIKPLFKITAVLEL
jgi:hypothetical protein